MVIVKGSVAEFRFFRPEAQHVHVVGDFTGWRCGQVRMEQTQEGYWKVQLPLEPGLYRFRYLADGQWFTDYAAFGVEYGPFGVDSILRVQPSASTVTEEPGELPRAIDARMGVPAPRAGVAANAPAMAGV